MSRTVELSIESIAAGGDGVGRTDGLVVFVPRTAPGDVITASLVSKKKHFGRGVIQHLTVPSPDRTDPPCVHYTRDNCGGCQLQHMTYASQLTAKQRMIADAMRRIGKRDVELPGIQESPDQWRYRTKLTLALHFFGSKWKAGLHPYDNPGRIFELEDCPITDTRVVDAWKEIMSASDLFPGIDELRGSVRWTDEGATFVLIGADHWTSHEEFFAAVPSISALYWEPLDQPRQLLADRRTNVAPAASFAQVNPKVAGELRAHVESMVLSYKPNVVVEGYSGNGELAVSLTQLGVAEVRAIEMDADAAEWASQRLTPPSISIQGRVEDEIEQHLPADVVILNPPRTGLHADIPAILEQAPPPRAIIYISCDPATLARDIARLPSFRIKTLTAFDMFPQTAHVETVCEFVPSETIA